MLKHIRIVIENHGNRLVYNNGRGLTAYSPLLYNRTGNGVLLRDGIRLLRQDIRSRRFYRRLHEDKILHRENNHVLNLLRQKRAREQQIAFESKKPIDSTKHVGVEIEFISKSDRKKNSEDIA